jgi:2,4-dienoyl-CoA reductase-like NADH-dependent reductase (Old Yellow Enzyme family)/thioredoxin reductase
MLFNEIHIGKMVLENRIVMPPLETNFANDDGTVSQRTIDHYERRARGGPGLIVVECTSVDPVHFHRNQLNISDDRFIEGLSRLAEVIKRHGVRAAIQIQHPGRQIVLPSAQSVAPSPLACRAIPRVPRELTIAEIEGLVKRFAEAAGRARDAGFDAVQFHGAHGYLIAQFMSAWSNKRTDRYGGDVYGRATFPLEIIAHSREKVGEDYPLIFRFSGKEYVPEGRGIDESKVIAQLVEKAGVDAISVSAGTYDSGEWCSQPMLMPRGCLVPLAAEIKRTVDLPVVAVGRIHGPRLAEEILEQNKADLIAMGRPLLADPDLPSKAKAGRERDINHCISCNTCMHSLSSGPVICLMNPELGREGTPEVKAPKQKNVLVVNGGPAGIEAARVAALRGHHVKLMDTKPSLAGRWSWLLRPYITNRLKLLAELSVAVELGKMITPEAVSQEKPEVVIAGLGLKPKVPLIPGMNDIEPMQADDIFNKNKNKDVTGKVAVLGGGSIGFEVAKVLVRNNCHVSIIEEGGRLGMGIEPLTGNVLRRQLAGLGVVFYNRARISRITGQTLVIVDREGAEQQIPFDHLVLALDWQPEDSLVDSLRGADYQLIQVSPYQHPARYVQAFKEGTAVGREI